MSHHKGGRAAIILVLVGGLGLGTFAYYVKTTPQAAHVPDEVRVHRKEKAASKVDPPAKDDPPVVVATKPVETDTIRLTVLGEADVSLSSKETTVPKGQNAMRFLAQKIADGSGIEGVRVVAVELREHVAFVDYNAAVEKGMGSMQEGMFLRALQVGFGQFAGVDRVAVEKEGQPLQSGHVDLSEPLRVIRPGQTEPEGGDPTPVEP